MSGSKFRAYKDANGFECPSPKKRRYLDSKARKPEDYGFTRKMTR